MYEINTVNHVIPVPRSHSCGVEDDRSYLRNKCREDSEIRNHMSIANNAYTSEIPLVTCRAEIPTVNAKIFVGD